ncbi:hypothetical protein OsI_26628 [Oryza sativa Indica Group]|jgi:hypothetical protein|uniref:Uncharacterized protein n=1 Tax=Oryza sativa subsp. indica TaxID=39946 RepID=B8B7S9_ORYSI|nr:hypothetical protein OsI_26628 [Oryza sativa Indica Group]
MAVPVARICRLHSLRVALLPSPPPPSWLPVMMTPPSLLAAIAMVAGDQVRHLRPLPVTLPPLLLWPSVMIAPPCHLVIAAMVDDNNG